jgi:hypothetical protein
LYRQLDDHDDGCDADVDDDDDGGEVDVFSNAIIIDRSNRYSTEMCGMARIRQAKFREGGHN